MGRRKSAGSIAFAFFLFWLVVLLAGADHPPPVGFLWVILFDIIAAWLVYIRIPVYIGWLTEKPKHRLVRVSAEGFAAGIIFSMIAIIANPSAEPDITVMLVNYGIWFVVIGIVGCINTLFLYSICALLYRDSN